MQKSSLPVMTALQRASQEHGRAGRVFLPRSPGVSEADLEALLDRTDLEAGKPIVATKGPGYEVVARGTGAGILSGVNA